MTDINGRKTGSNFLQVRPRISLPYVIVLSQTSKLILIFFPVKYFNLKQMKCVRRIILRLKEMTSYSLASN